MVEVKCLIKEPNPFRSNSKSNWLVTELWWLMIEFSLFVLVGLSCVTYNLFPKDYGGLFNHQKHSYWTLFSKYICNWLL